MEKEPKDILQEVMPNGEESNESSDVLETNEGCEYDNWCSDSSF